MGGGLMQLVAYGAQDVYLTGASQITFFKVVYRRHTNFSMETIEHTVNGNPNFGRNTSVTILRNGDLAGKMYLKVKLNPVRLALRNVNERLRVAWVRRLGHCMVKDVEVEIGGSRIDKQYGVWLDIWYELTHDFNQERGYRQLIGDVEALTKLTSVVDTTETDILPEYTLYVPLQFWFNRNTGLALPLIALQYHEVRLHFEFEEVNKLIIWSGDVAPNSNAFSMKDASVLVDYIYLDSEERRRFAQVGHEYLIEQVQFQNEESLNDNSNGVRISERFKLSFNHPCKELIWALKNGAFNGEATKNLTGNRGKFLTYTHDDSKWESEALDYAADNIARGMISFTEPETGILGKDYEVVTLEADSDTTEFTPAALPNLVITFKYPKQLGTDVEAWVILAPLIIGSYNLAKFIHKFDVTVTFNDTFTILTSYEVDVTSNSLSLIDVSVPIEDWEDNRTTTTGSFNPFDITVVQCCNYGTRLDGKGNPVNEAVINLNGHDRFEAMEGAYFNYLQPWQHHTRTPADGINVYSFALHPEQHQPSGSANLSRIDNTLLLVKFSDPFRANTNRPKLNLGRDSKFYVFAFSYNILRVMSGMAGIAYSN